MKIIKNSQNRIIPTIRKIKINISATDTSSLDDSFEETSENNL